MDENQPSDRIKARVTQSDIADTVSEIIVNPFEMVDVYKHHC